MYIKTERLTLGVIEDRHKCALMALFNDSEIKKTYMIPDFKTEEDALRMLERFVSLSYAPDRYVAGICLGDELIGFLNDTEIDGDKIELGYVISPTHKNQGYATEALMGMIKYLFSSGFAEVICGAFEKNEASIKVMLKSGMTLLEKTDVIEYRGEKHRCVYYSRKR